MLAAARMERRFLAFSLRLSEARAAHSLSSGPFFLSLLRRLAAARERQTIWLTIRLAIRQPAPTRHRSIKRFQDSLRRKRVGATGDRRRLRRRYRSPAGWLA
jgi:hypothetical protein